MKHEQVQTYYGEVLQTSADLQTNACCTPGDIPAHLKPVLAGIHDEVAARYYGCGLIAPEALEGARVLDLGCGAGRDVYALSKMVGPEGSVVGVDMTAAQLAVAERHRDWHRAAYGHATSNVAFLQGYIERLEDLALEPGSFDIIVSNCVLNLATDKAAVLRGACRLLKDGGEMYFSDVYADRRIPAALAEDEVLYGECLSGALYWNDFLGLARAAGFLDPRQVTTRPLSIGNQTLADKVSPIAFHSTTYRLFKLPALESDCEDYGQAVVYRGTVPHAPKAFRLDEGHLFPAGKVVPVCGNSWMMLHDTRLRAHFDFIGDFSTHFGIFEGCGGKSPFLTQTASDSASCC